MVAEAAPCTPRGQEAKLVMFTPLVRTPNEQPSPRPYWFVFRQGDMLVSLDGPTVRVPRRLSVEGVAAPGSPVFLGTLDGVCCYAAEAAGGLAPDARLSFMNLRELFTLAGDDLFSVAGFASQVLTWDRTHRFCGCCAAPMERHAEERAKVCPACGHVCFPRLNPAVITAVRRGDCILLAHNRRHRSSLFSVIAGFVEAGETLEEAVRREIREEVGVEVTNIRYFGSQPWPFPSSLMLGFKADHASGEIRVDGHEIGEAGWFRAANMPEIPGPISISRRLIDDFIEGQHGGSY